MKNLFILLILIITVVLCAYVVYQIGFDVVTRYIKDLLGINYSKIYNLYGYQYVEGVRSSGPILKSYTNVESSLICANYAATTDGCVGGNYIASTSTCELVSALLPLSANASYCTFTLSATKLNNGVSAFVPSQGVRQKGVLFCDTTLNYQPYAAALCANIPSCSGYLSTFTDNQVPSGCLLTDSAQQSILLDDAYATLYTGTRNDAQFYNHKDATLYYRWETDVQSDLTSASNILTTQFATTLDECGMLVQQTVGANGAVWNSDTNGTCDVYTNINRIQASSNTTLITTKAYSRYLAMSNAYNKMDGVIYPTAITVTTGLEKAISYTLNDALIACANNSDCNCIIHDTAENTFVFQKVTSSDLPSTDSSKIAYLLPDVFV